MQRMIALSSKAHRTKGLKTKQTSVARWTDNSLWWMKSEKRLLPYQADNSEAGQVPAPEALIYYRTTLLQATAAQSEK